MFAMCALCVRYVFVMNSIHVRYEFVMNLIPVRYEFAMFVMFKFTGALHVWFARLFVSIQMRMKVQTMDKNYLLSPQRI